MRISRVATALFALQGAAWGTDCGIPPPCMLLLSGSALFTGKVIAVDPTAGAGGAPMARVQVTEGILGLNKGEREVRIPQLHGAVGTEYFFDIVREKDGRFLWSICNSTSQLDRKARNLVAQLRKLKNSGKASVDISLHIDEKTAPEMPVVLEGPSGRKEGHTDREGRLSFRGLKPGRYRWNTTVAHYHPRDQENEWELVAGGCPSEYAYLRGEGSVVGTVKDASNKPVSDLTLELMKSDLTTFRVTTDTQGRFRFGEVSPGQYRLGTNLGEGKTAVIPRWVYPTGTEEINVTWIEVPAGGEVRGLELNVPDYGGWREIRFRVIDQQGVPVAGAYVLNARSKDEFGGLPKSDITGLKTDTSGTAVARVREKVGYMILAGLYEGTFPNWKTSTAQEIPAGSGSHEITLQLNPSLAETRK